MNRFIGSSGDGVDDVNHAAGWSVACSFRYLSWLDLRWWGRGVELLDHVLAYCGAGSIGIDWCEGGGMDCCEGNDIGGVYDGL